MTIQAAVRSLPARLVSTVTGADGRSVERWRTGTEPRRSEFVNRLDDLVAILDLLGPSMTNKGKQAWLTSRSGYLGMGGPPPPRPSRYNGPLSRQTALGVPGCQPPFQPAPHPGRYHLAGDPWPMYGSVEEPTVWVEWAHATGGGVAPEGDPRWLCVFDADLSVLDLRRPEILDALNVTVDDLNADWAPGAPNSACLKVSAAAAAAGAGG